MTPSPGDEWCKTSEGLHRFVVQFDGPVILVVCAPFHEHRHMYQVTRCTRSAGL